MRDCTSAIRVCGLAFAGLLLGGSLAPAAAAKHHRRHAVVRPVTPPLGPEDSPVPREAAGIFGGYFNTGILGASEADPYERSGYGYLTPNERALHRGY